jgi:DNA ligase-associated metallophosphoesterase
MDFATIGAGVTQGVDVELGGTPVRLLARRALWWPAQRTAFVADVHLGKAETFRALGVPVPIGPTEATLARLAELVDGLGAQRLVVLGDLLHARPAQAPAVIDALHAWRHARAALHCVLVRGNHDDRAGDPPPSLGIEVVGAPFALGPFALCHEPLGEGVRAVPAGGYRLAGHVHPAVRLHGRGGDSVRLPCFRIGPDEAVLPAFGAFTGAATLAREAGVSLYAIAGDRVMPVPAAAVGGGRVRRGLRAGRQSDQ